MACVFNVLSIHMIKQEIIPNFILKSYIFHHKNEDILCIFNLAYVIKAVRIVSEFIDTERHLTGVI